MTLRDRGRQSTRWLSDSRSPDDARIRLFCLPHAGAGTAVFHTWKRLLPAFVEVFPILLPGREGRISEPSYTNCEQLIEQITLALADYTDEPYAIFGHSMGALLALDLALSLRDRGPAQPRYLFVSGRNATHVPMNRGNIHALPEEAFLTALATRYGGLPREVLDTPDLLDLYLPILRADLTLLETHCYFERGPLVCPIAAFSGRDDRNVSKDGLEAWGNHTTGTFETMFFDGGHFYLSGPSRAPLLSLIAERLASALSSGVSDERPLPLLSAGSDAR